MDVSASASKTRMRGRKVGAFLRRRRPGGRDLSLPVDPARGEERGMAGRGERAAGGTVVTQVPRSRSPVDGGCWLDRCP